MEFAQFLKRSPEGEQPKPKSVFKFGLLVGGLTLSVLFLLRRQKKKRVRFADPVAADSAAVVATNALHSQPRGGSRIVEEDARGNQRLPPRVYAAAQPAPPAPQGQDYSPGFDEDKWLASLPPPDMGMGNEVESYIENERVTMEEYRRKNRGRPARSERRSHEQDGGRDGGQDDEHQVFNIGQVDFPLA